MRQRPGKNVRAAPLENSFLSRRHLAFSVGHDAMEIEAVGRKPLRLGDGDVRSATVREGNVVEIASLYTLYCARRPRFLPEATTALAPDFGAADAYGIVGEPPVA